jgi:hypothetical protein
MLHLGGARGDPKRVYNLAGQLPLSELPGLLTHYALFIGTTAVPSTSQQVWVCPR